MITDQDRVGIINTAAAAVVSNVYWRHYCGGQCFEMQISGESGRRGGGGGGGVVRLVLADCNNGDPSVSVPGVAAGADIVSSVSWNP